MIYIIGVDHKIQHDGKNSFPIEKRIMFSEYLKNKIEKIKIDILFEEFNEAALNAWGGKNFTIKPVVEGFIKHVFCDPTNEERLKLGIKTDKENCAVLNAFKSLQVKEKTEQKNKTEKENSEKREKFWLERIKKFIFNNALFVCGDNHIITDNFIKILNNAGFETTIEDRWNNLCEYLNINEK